MAKKKTKPPTYAVDVEFDVGHLLRVLNVLDQAIFALSHKGKDAEIQKPEYRKIMRNELALVAKGLMNLNAMDATEHCVLIVEALADRLGILEFLKIDPLVLEFKKALATEFESMRFAKVKPLH